MPKLPAYYSDTKKPSAGELLDKLLGADYLGGPSVRGWSKISTYMICDQMYYLEGIRKMRPRAPAAALDIGTLLHACLAAHYWTGGVKTWEPLEILQPHLPELVEEVKRLLNAYFYEHGAEEAATWDVRAVEYEIVGHMEHQPAWSPVPLRALCSGRFDLVIRKKAPGAPNHPYGPCPDGVWICDHKTARAVTRDLVEGYGMDGQFLLMAYLWKQQNFDAIFGKLNGFIINVITKGQTVVCKRLEVMHDDRDAERYARTLAPVLVEMDVRTKHPSAQDPANWPMNFAVCKSPRGYGLCKFWDYCSSFGANDKLYEIGAPPKIPAP